MASNFFGSVCVCVRCGGGLMTLGQLTLHQNDVDIHTQIIKHLLRELANVISVN